MPPASPSLFMSTQPTCTTGLAPKRSSTKLLLASYHVWNWSGRTVPISPLMKSSFI
jgi:hypothetical protein